MAKITVSLAVLIGGAYVAASSAAAQSPGSRDLASLLTRVGDRVEQYYTRAQTVVCMERVRLQQLGADFMPAGRIRDLVYELRIVWDPATGTDKPPEATITRQILKVDGRPPRPDFEPGCTDPRSVSPEPLAMLLTGKRSEYVFSHAGAGKTDRRPATMIDYKGIVTGPPDLTWKNDCVSISLPGRSKGRVWVNPQTDEVLRLDEQLTESFGFRVPREQRAKWMTDWVSLERADTSIRYKPVTFRDPEETLLLPDSIEMMTVFRGEGMSRLRTTQVFSGYRRFLTGGRILEDPR